MPGSGRDAMAVKTEAAPYLDAFRPDAEEPAWLREARGRALAAFGERGFPSRREEAWRFTNLRPLTETFFAPARPASPSTGTLDAQRRGGVAFPTHRLVFVNGVLRSGAGELPNGVWLGSLKEALAQNLDWARAAIDPSDLAGGQPLSALNAALFADGFGLALDAGVTLDRPVEVIHIGDGRERVSIHTRHFVALAPGSRATLIETFSGAGDYWTNSVAQLSLAGNSSLNYSYLQDESEKSIHLRTVRGALAKSSNLKHFSLTLGAHLSKVSIFLNLGDGAAVDVSGAYLQRGDQDATHAVVIDHAEPNATTHELFKGVLDERAHGAFLGTIRVREGAQKTDAKQTSRALLLSDRAWVDTKPELEILADDVKCAHGAAVGDLDKETLFYLRARGIGEDEARRMLIEAFVLDAVETVESPALREHLASQVRRWLAREAA